MPCIYTFPLYIPPAGHDRRSLQAGLRDPRHIYVMNRVLGFMHIHGLGGAYGKVNLDIPGTQPERDLLCCHIFPDNLAVASILIVNLCEYTFPLLVLDERDHSYFVNLSPP